MSLSYIINSRIFFSLTCFITEPFIVKWGIEQPKIRNLGLAPKPYRLEMKQICQMTGATLENLLWKGFQFTVISSNKTEKFQQLIITPLFGVKFGWYQGKVGPVAHHNSTMNWLVWGNIGHHHCLIFVLHWKEVF